MKKFLVFVFSAALFQATAILAAELPEPGMMLYFDNDELVESATRAAKPLSQTAEDVVIIDREEIIAMNAHNLNDVLARVTGMFVGFSGHDYGGYAKLQINESDNRHTLLLVDSIPLNSLAGGNPDAMTIPVEIIKRVEIIRGPAASAWGSALGGVVNVITRDAAGEAAPSGSLSYARGERGSFDSRVAVNGGAGPFGYYVYAGEQKSDGLSKDRSYKNDSLFGKFTLHHSSASNLTFSSGYSDPSYLYGNLPYAAIFSDGQVRTSWYRLALEQEISAKVSFSASVYHLDHKYVQNNMENGTYGPFGDLFKNLIYDEKSLGTDMRLVVRKGPHTVVAGGNFFRGELDQTIESGAWYQSLGAMPVQYNSPRIERRAFYVNDTMLFGDLSVTPGLRFDQNSVTSEDVYSPSLGLTFRIDSQTLARFFVARGHTDPALVDISGGGLFVDPNPELEVEKVWSYQAGIEGRAADLFWYKIGLFRHEIKDVFREVDSTVTSGNTMFENQGKERRTGLSLEFETPSFHNFSLRGGGTLVHVQKYDGSANPDPYKGVLSMRYDDRSLALDLTGVYTWWDQDSSYDGKGDYDDMIWDLNLRKAFGLRFIKGDIFATIHNLFNGHSYVSIDYPDPQRWVEAGVRLKF